jgi:PAS domain S-box-containing protein
VSRHLRVLLIEDREDDASLLLHTLRRAGFDPEGQRVESKATLERALDDSWDLILCDYRMPKLDAPTALAVVRGRRIDTPCIIVSGTVGEEYAVAALRSGAQDFILKQNLARLIPAIERELRDSETRIKQARAETALRETEASFRAAFELIPDGVLVHRDGVVLHANSSAASLLGATAAQDLAGRALLELFAPSAHDAVNAQQRSIDHSPHAPIPIAEMAMIGLDHRVVHVETTGMSVVFDGDVATLSVLRDVSARRELVARTMQLDRMLSVGTLAAGIGHEINNPLAYVMANVTYAGDRLSRLRRQIEKRTYREASSDAEGLSEVISILGEVDDGAHRIREIARDLNTFARNDEALTLVDVRAAADTALRMAAHQVRDRARVIRQYDEVPPVRASGSRLSQVFLNLILNAAQAIPSGAHRSNEISVRIRADGPRVVAEVRDTGAGISPGNRERLFTAFFTTKPAGEGTGLGLSISRRIVRSFGGDIEVDSALGKGTTMRITLPAALDAAREPRPSTAPPPRRGKLLFIADESQVGTAFQRALAAEHDVVVFDDADAAVAKLKGGEAFDVIFCDVTIPGVVYRDFCQVVASSLPQLIDRIVLVTGAGSPHGAKEFAGRKLPIVEKPLAMDNVREVLADVLPVRR